MIIKSIFQSLDPEQTSKRHKLSSSLVTKIRMKTYVFHLIYEDFDLERAYTIKVKHITESYLAYNGIR